MYSFFQKISGILNGKTSDRYDWHDNWHEEFIVHLAKIIRPEVYVELGLYRCGLFNKMIPFAGQLYGVDINAEAKKFLKKSSNSTFYQMRTIEFAEKIKEKSILIDMLFIDADHSKKSVLEDFHAFFPFVRPHGLILIHDTHPRNKDFLTSDCCYDGYQAIQELSNQTSNYELVTLPIHPGLTLIRKRTTQLSWQE
jgi:predicted O-methyltransferase YrrM